MTAGEINVATLCIICKLPEHCSDLKVRILFQVPGIHDVEHIVGTIEAGCEKGKIAPVASGKFGS